MAAFQPVKAEAAYKRSLAPWQMCLRTSGINKALVKQGRLPDWEANIVLCKEAVRLESDSSKVSYSLVALAQAYEGLNQRDTAISLYLESIRLLPRPEVDLYFSLANLYRKKRKTFEAIAMYKEVRRIEPDNPKAHHLLGETYGELGRWQDAVKSYQKAVKLNPAEAEAHLGLGEAYEKIGEWDLALLAYYEAIQLQSYLAPAYYGLGRTYGQKGQLDLAVTAYREAIRLDHSLAEAHYDLGRAYSQKGLIDDGIASYREAIHLKPDFVEARYSLGMAYAVQKRRALADDYLYQAALLYIEEGNREKALKAYGHLRDLKSPLADRVFKKLYP
jgi:tetratricopeptide (TPR) repeat protein